MTIIWWNRTLYTCQWFAKSMEELSTPEIVIVFSKWYRSTSELFWCLLVNFAFFFSTNTIYENIATNWDENIQMAVAKICMQIYAQKSIMLKTMKQFCIPTSNTFTHSLKPIVSLLKIAHIFPFVSISLSFTWHSRYLTQSL